MDVVLTRRQVIADKLLTELDDGGKVAILCKKEDLELLMKGLDMVAACKRSEASERASQFLKDMKQLYDVSFGGGR